MLAQLTFELAIAAPIVVVDVTSFVATRLPVPSLIFSVDVWSPAFTLAPAVADVAIAAVAPACVGEASTLVFMLVIL